LQGAELELASPSQGACEEGAELGCALGDIEAGASATVSLSLRTSAVATEASVAIETWAVPGCQEAKVRTIALREPTTPAAADVAGGCGCAYRGRSEQAAFGWLLVAASLGLWARGRRRQPASVALATPSRSG
jgi:hypothetical protein